MSNSDLKDTLDWANTGSDESNKSSTWSSWLPILFIVLLLALAGWWWWVNYGQAGNNDMNNSTAFNDLKAGAKADNPLLVRPNGRVVSSE